MESSDSFQGQLLIASPNLRDPNFRQTVVLIVEHNDNGTLGLVLNRPSETAISEIWSKIADSPCTTDQPLYIGGPVEGPLMAIHTHEELANSTVGPGVYCSVEKDRLNAIVATADDSFRLFVGHAGWGAGQLNSEMEGGSWLTLPATLELIFFSGDDLWDKVRSQVAQSSFVGRLGIKQVPDDPRMN